jgi:quercetin dioxygenase-like cupin family protein
MSEPLPNVREAQVALGLVKNLWTRQMHFLKAGDIESGHAHQFDHCTLLAYGSLTVTVNGKSKDFKAPQMIYIKAGEYHELKALEDDTVAFCIHALRDKETGDIISPDMLPAGIQPQEVLSVVAPL